MGLTNSYSALVLHSHASTFGGIYITDNPCNNSSKIHTVLGLHGERRETGVSRRAELYTEINSIFEWTLAELYSNPTEIKKDSSYSSVAIKLEFWRSKRIIQSIFDWVAPWIVRLHMVKPHLTVKEASLICKKVSIGGSQSFGDDWTFRSCGN